MRGARLLLAVAVTLPVVACGGGDQPVSGTSAPDATSAPASGSADDSVVTTAPESTTTTSTSTSTTTTTVPEPFDAIVSAAAEATATPRSAPEPDLGAPDFGAAAAVIADLGLAEILDDDAGDIWIFPVVGTDDRLLVVEIYPSVEQAESESDTDLFEAIVASEAVADAGVTRFVFHYFDTDEEGDFVLTLTMPFDALVRFVTEDADVADEILVEQRRIEWSS